MSDINKTNGISTLREGDLLTREIVDLLRRESKTAENQGELTGAQMQLIYEKKWLQLFVPKRYGGLQLSLPEGVRLQENIAYADGSVGWVVTLCGGANMFAGFFDEALATDVFTSAATCLAGSGQPNGVAINVGEGYRVTGRWLYASGAPHATHFTANCVIQSTGKIESFLFTKAEVEIHRDWNYIGLNATAGHSFSVTDCFVPFNRTFKIDHDLSSPGDLVNRYPFQQFAEATIAVNIAGMCRYFLELAQHIINRTSSNSHTQPMKQRGIEIVGSAFRQIGMLREAFYRALDSSWNTHHPSPTFAAVSESGLQLAKLSRSLVNDVYPFCGMEAARSDSTINQVWRNINTASQHTLLR
jgi:alkylation response protein AidB-like acyl-CoA dehydrogenase